MFSRDYFLNKTFLQKKKAKIKMLATALIVWNFVFKIAY